MTKPLRIGVLGAGWAAGLHLEGFRRTPGVVLAAICSRTRRRAELRADEFGIHRVIDSVEDLVDAVDVVTIATPPDAHLAPALTALAAGRHLLCDKPLAVTADDARTMLDAARKAGTHHAAGFIWRGDPALIRMRDLLRAGAIGPILEIHSTCALGVPPLPMTWMYEAERGGGALAQHGSHVVDRARWLVGGDFTEAQGRLHHDLKEATDAGGFSDITEAFAWAREHAGVKGPTSAVSADTGYDFTAVLSNGVRALFWEAWHLGGPAEDEVVVFGENGTLSWRGNGGLTLYRPRTAPEQLADAAAGSGANTPREVGLTRWAGLAAAFTRAIQGDETAEHPTLVDGWQVAAVSDAVRRSSISGSRETVR